MIQQKHFLIQKKKKKEKEATKNIDFFFKQKLIQLIPKYSSEFD